MAFFLDTHTPQQQRSAPSKTKILLLECQDRSGNCLWRKWLAPSSFGHIGTTTEYQYCPDSPHIEETFRPAVQLEITADERIIVWALQRSANIDVDGENLGSTRKTLHITARGSIIVLRGRVQYAAVSLLPQVRRQKTR
jgi:hypothetical protein